MNEFKKRSQWCEELFDHNAFWGLMTEVVEMSVLDEARKDFVKDFTDEDFFTLVQYGLEDDAKLTPDAIKVKNEILIRWAKQSAPAFLHWFGEEKQKNE